MAADPCSKQHRHALNGFKLIVCEAEEDAERKGGVRLSMLPGGGQADRHSFRCSDSCRPAETPLRTAANRLLRFGMFHTRLSVTPAFARRLPEEPAFSVFRRIDTAAAEDGD